MKSWIHEEILKTWTDAQKRLWESLCSAVPFQPPAGVEAWRETYLKNLASWEAAVKRTLEKEAAWVEEWVQRVAREKGTPEMMASWVQQMDEVLHRWIETQNQWWNDYFSLLRRGGFMQPDLSGTQPFSTAEAAAETGPAAVESVVVAALPTPAETASAAVEAAAAEVAIKPVEVEVEVEAVKAAITSAATEAAAAPVVVEPAVATEPPIVVEQPSILSEPVITSVETAPVLPMTIAASEVIADAVPIAEPVVGQPDDLKLINGIGPALEKKLNASGIFSFRDLATLSEADIERIEAAIKFAGRIHREDWLGQAKAQHFHKYQEQL